MSATLAVGPLVSVAPAIAATASGSGSVDSSNGAARPTPMASPLDDNGGVAPLDDEVIVANEADECTELGDDARGAP